ncbi:MAG: cytochrome C biogenesis protein [Gammaproteobacteria bacterium HGW-Gammaproteobacteria-11]|nr:MAG: cytochrome C biogenesis protein [Gammaproteobacteria bacterium HGW-Gammaproteobacteria-11]
MAMELASIPLAFLAGVIGILSPCVWPLVPVIMSSAANSGRFGPLYLALGLASSFAVAGTFLTLLLLNIGLDPVAFRYLAAAMLILVAIMLLSSRVGDRVSFWLSRLTSHFNLPVGGQGSAAGQFGIGALLGLVWLPCIGPTLGAAIALASMGQDLGLAFMVMLAFGLGTAASLLAAAWVSASVLKKIRPGLLTKGQTGKRVLGWLLLILGLVVMTGLDKVLETWAVSMLPQWALGF